MSISSYRITTYGTKLNEPFHIVLGFKNRTQHQLQPDNY